ncbi:hypothetical protein [Salipiger abyssi]|uniref:Sulfotransferase family protein n=1 Tax=Salipiger abyssi TaxID=1250539 RepID=A0A1P8V0N5_9RHOB|nr:hypothetical protein [Salipiger abyssi]APZ55188.1 Sulfotransferase family protein [Salipiger abyssi]
MEVHHSPVRTIHHFACSGGTVVSKCIAVCGDSFFLSEVNPLAPYNDIKFAPLDLLSQLQAQYRNMTKQYRMEFFGDQMRLLARISDQAKRPICLRDHTHSSFFRPGGVHESELLEALKVLGYDTLSVATVRHPVDAFAAMLKNKWAGGIQNSFEIYCTKLMAFLDYCERREVGLWRYEDFCLKPAETLGQICERLALPFNENFLEDFQNIKLSGDSGRRSADIHLRTRRSIAPDLAAEAADSELYHTVCSRLGYTAAVDEYPLQRDFQSH